MQDVLIQADEVGLYDIQIDGADFASAGGFESAIPVSLFTDSRVEPQIVQAAQRRRGFVGDILFRDIPRKLGSVLWILDQARLTQNTINDARIAAQEALQWFVDDGIVLNVSVEVDRKSLDSVEILMTFTDIDNVIKRYVALWRATNAANISNV